MNPNVTEKQDGSQASPPGSCSVACPDREGVWELDGEEIDVYPLEPTGGQLCIWGPDVGNGYTGAQDTQFPWLTDEWQGHIPVQMYDDKGPWKFLRPLNE